MLKAQGWTHSLFGALLRIVAQKFNNTAQQKPVLYVCTYWVCQATTLGQHLLDSFWSWGRVARVLGLGTFSITF